MSWKTLLLVISIQICQKTTEAVDTNARCKDDNAMDIILAANNLYPQQASDKDLLFQGDIDCFQDDRCDQIKKIVSSNNEAVTNLQSNFWTNNIIPYEFDQSAAPEMIEILDYAIEQFDKKTCVNWTKRTDQTNHVVFRMGMTCKSPVGMRGGRQYITMTDNCWQVGSMVHLMMHTAGFWHENSKLNRDDTIRVNWGNIQRDYTSAFAKINTGSTWDRYDKNGIMNYPRDAFSKNGSMTYECKNSGLTPVGNKEGLSDEDVLMVNHEYNCPNHWRPEGKDGMATPAPNPAPEPVKPVVTVCHDDQPFCFLLSMWCTNDWVKTYCRNTCKMCDPGVTKPAVQGNWGEWTPWGACSKTCGQATRMRARFCDSPAPSNGGQRCLGEQKQTDSSVCGKPCPVPVTSPPVLSECKDTHASCTDWSGAGYCTNPITKWRVEKSCKKSCGSCKVVVTANCVDKSDQCELWSHLCESLKERMKTSCPKTCNFC